MENRSRVRAATDRNPSPAEYNRRQALKATGRFAAYMTPGMTVLLRGTSAEACHKPGHQDVPGQNCSGTP
jgi:hypothetical protein